MAFFKKFLKALSKGFKKLSLSKPKRRRTAQRGVKASRKKLHKRRFPRTVRAARRRKKPVKKKTPAGKRKKKLHRQLPPRTAKPPKAKEPPAREIGEVTHYFSKIGVCVLKLTKSSIALGDTIEFRGQGKKFSQVVRSLQIENADVQQAQKGKLVGLKVEKIAKPGLRVYRVG